LSGAADRKDLSGADLAKAVRLVTTTVNAVWDLQVRMGEGVHEHVRDAVLDLVRERGPRAKFQMIVERPELRSHEAERLLDRAADYFRSLALSEPGNVRNVRFFEAHLDFIKLVRAGRVDLGRVPVEPLTAAERAKVLADPAPTQSATELHNWAHTLRDRGQIEEARAAFTEAVRQARATGDAAVEGSAELALYKLAMETFRASRSRQQRMREHASRAEDAYRRAGDRIGEHDAIVALIAVLTDTADQPNLDRALDRLARLDEDHARWWRGYSTAMTAAELERHTAGLRWCIESAHLLGDQAGYYRRMCEAKLQFSEQLTVPPDSDGTAQFRGSAVMFDVVANGPSKEAAERLDKLVQDVELMRRYARSQALQRELSDTHQVTYWAAARCAEALRSPEDAVDLNELASSRALLTQAGMQEVWQRWHPGTWGEFDRAQALQDLLGRFTVAPTDPQPSAPHAGVRRATTSAGTPGARAPLGHSRTHHLTTTHAHPQRPRAARRGRPSGGVQLDRFDLSHRA
jgi:tetratricopeptide (TPR) repeat protein